MSWKDRSKETQAVWSGLALCAVAAIVITLYLIAGKEDRGMEMSRQMAAMEQVSKAATMRAVKEYGR